MCLRSSTIEESYRCGDAVIVSTVMYSRMMYALSTAVGDWTVEGECR